MPIVTQPASKPRVVVVGAGFGGLEAAKALGGEGVDVTVVDRRNHHLFQPLLYQVATAALSPGDISYPIRAVLRKLKNERTLLGQAVAVDPGRRKVLLRDGEIGYDYLVLAAGARHSYFGNDRWERAAPGLKDLEDALEMRRRILLAFERAERETDPKRREALLTFVIVGGGPTGVELAGAIAEIATRVLRDDFRSIDPADARVILVEAAPRVLPTFPEKLSRQAEAALRRLGCWVWTNKRITAVEADHAGVDGRRVDCFTTLWAAGVQASPLGASLGAAADRAGRILVNPDLTVPGRPEIFVVGDMARFETANGPLPAVAPVATQQGRHAARNIRRALAGQPLAPFRYHDRGMMATIGRAAAVAQIGKLRLAGLAAWLLWLFVHILHLVGFRNRLAVTLNWAWAYVRMQRGARLIYGDIESSSAPQPSGSGKVPAA